MNIYILTYGLEKPRAFINRLDCAFEVWNLLTEEEAEYIPSMLDIADDLIKAEVYDEEAVYAVDWKSNLVVRAYAVKLEEEF